jgi:signal transduction histidine kinase
MAEIIRDSQILVHTLAMQKVLEGLIHNINTPLNLILGYSQQLKKQHPDIAHLDRIYEAGLLIDDLMQSCARNIIQRLGREKESFELNTWLMDEIKQFNNVLEIKHKICFITDLPALEIWTESSPILLSLFLESLILYVRNCSDKAISCEITIGITQSGNNAEISVKVPEIVTPIDTLQYLQEVQTELESYSGISFTREFPFSWEYIDTVTKIFVPMKRK